LHFIASPGSCDAMKTGRGPRFSIRTVQISRTPTPALALQGVSVRRPVTVAEAVALLDDLGAEAAPLAGATWVMRAAQYGRPLAPVQVALTGVRELGELWVRPHQVTVGALVTHARLAAAPSADPAFSVVVEAAAKSAFPAVRHMATVGGNLATVAFPEADLVPALLAAEATVRLVQRAARAELPVATYLPLRPHRPAAELIASVVVPLPAGQRRSAYERLTIRGGGEYATAAVAVSLDLTADGLVGAARIAPGAVEATARLLPGAAAALAGAPLTDERIAAAALAAAAEVRPREAPDAPGWYRARMLSVLVRRALERLRAQAEAGA
jgi:aerobic carbon-monoxide dehydrogenase medium subunit